MLINACRLSHTERYQPTDAESASLHQVMLLHSISSLLADGWYEYRSIEWCCCHFCMPNSIELLCFVGFSWTDNGWPAVAHISIFQVEGIGSFQWIYLIRFSGLPKAATCSSSAALWFPSCNSSHRNWFRRCYKFPATVEGMSRRCSADPMST